MIEEASVPKIRRWNRHLFYRKESIQTTWKLRLALPLSLVLILTLTRGFWIPKLGQSLVCQEGTGNADAILVEQFDLNYLLFERAQALHDAGLGSRVLVLAEASNDAEKPNMVSQGIVDLMTRVARLRNAEVLAVHENEPVSLNAAYQIRKFLKQEHISSLIVVAAGLRSRRSSLVYDAVLRPAGLSFYCVPVFGARTPQTWAQTWHGIQEVVEQFLKLQYYRFYVLPFRLR